MGREFNNKLQCWSQLDALHIDKQTGSWVNRWLHKRTDRQIDR